MLLVHPFSRENLGCNSVRHGFRYIYIANIDKFNELAVDAKVLTKWRKHQMGFKKMHLKNVFWKMEAILFKLLGVNTAIEIRHWAYKVVPEELREVQK